MPQYVIIADELTGANATSVFLKKMNYSAFTALGSCEGGLELRLRHRRTPCVREGARRLRHVARGYVKLYSKRVDSTLRGNVGSEIDAHFDFLGEEYVPSLCCAFPPLAGL